MRMPVRSCLALVAGAVDQLHSALAIGAIGGGSLLSKRLAHGGTLAGGLDAGNATPADDIATDDAPHLRRMVMCTAVIAKAALAAVAVAAVAGGCRSHGHREFTLWAEAGQVMLEVSGARFGRCCGRARGRGFR